MLLRRRPEIKIKFLLSCGAQNTTGLRGAEIYDTSRLTLQAACANRSYSSCLRLEDYFERELDLSLRDGCSDQRARDGIEGSGTVKDVGIAVAYLRRRKIGVIDDVKHLRAELHVEGLRDAPDVVVLEHREVQAGDAGANQNIAPGIASEVETLREHGGDRRRVWVRRSGGRLSARGKCVAVIVPKSRVRRAGDGEALRRFDVVGRIARIRQSVAAGSAKPVREGKIVAAERASRI